MTMMSTPDDDMYRHALAAYVSDTTDDGFSSAFLESLGEREQRQREQQEQRIRRFVLLAAFLLAGFIAGQHAPEFFKLLVGLVPTLDSSMLRVPSVPVTNLSFDTSEMIARMSTQPIFVYAAGAIGALIGLISLIEASEEASYL